jgi:hypothetical protein
MLSWRQNQVTLRSATMNSFPVALETVNAGKMKGIILSFAHLLDPVSNIISEFWVLGWDILQFCRLLPRFFRNRLTQLNRLCENFRLPEAYSH